MSFETILPFLRPVEALLVDPTVSEIMINPGSGVFVERNGVCMRAADVGISDAQVRTAAVMIARHLGEEIGEDRPLLDARLPDGSRVAVAFPPCSVGGAAMTIRKFQRHLFTLDELLRVGMVPKEAWMLLKDAVLDQKNILISGGTGSGKTTLLNALVALIPPCERLVVIEDTAELQIEQPNRLRLEARRSLGDAAAVTIRDLLRATLRHRPDRIIVGEVRGAEAFDLLQALNTGHGGSLTTIHANGVALAVNRLTTCAQMAQIGMPYQATRLQIADSIHLLVHVERGFDGRRLVTLVSRLERYDAASDRFEVEHLFEARKPHAITIPQVDRR